MGKETENNQTGKQHDLVGCLFRVADFLEKYREWYSVWGVKIVAAADSGSNPPNPPPPPPPGGH